MALAPAAGMPASDDWPETTVVGYVVTSMGGGRELRVSVTSDGTMEIEGIGTYRIAETVPVAELRGGPGRAGRGPDLPAAA